MTELTFYGGVGEIGGNKILLQERDTKVFLDFGRNFEKERRYFEEPFLTAREEKHLLSLGILPRIKGLYKKDPEDPDIGSILVSHPHMDHVDYIRYVKNSVPIVCGDLTRKIITAREFYTKAKSADYQIANLTKTRGEEVFKEFRALEGKESGKIDSLEVAPYEVDHSVHGAYGFILHASEGSLAYTGDFRMHGARRGLTERFVEKAREERVDSLIIEGTNVVEGKPSTEDEVKDKTNELVSKAKKLVLANFSLVDIERLLTFLEVAKNNDRKLAISMKQAYLLHYLRDEFPVSPDDPNILIFLREKKTLSCFEDLICNNYPDNVVKSPDVNKMQEEIILVCSFYDMNEMCEIRPETGSVFVLSQSEPFNEEMEIEYEKLLNWLELYGLPLYNIHASGHMLPHQLKEVVAEISPRKAYLVHTERPMLFKRFLEDLRVDVVCPEVGESYPIA